MIDPVVHYLLVCLLALVFLQGGAAKLTARDEFQGVVSSYRLLPPAMVPAFAALLPYAELAAGIGIILPATRHPGAALALALLVMFALAMTINSCVASRTPKLSDLPNVNSSEGIRTIRAPNDSATETVPSVEPESTRMISTSFRV